MKILGIDQEEYTPIRSLSYKNETFIISGCFKLGITRFEMQSIFDQCVDNLINSEINNENIFFRCTDNKNEISLIESKKIKKSLNHITNIHESGLSVSEHPYYSEFNGYKYVYLITGTVIGSGSDGKPILDMKSLHPISKMFTSYRAIKDYDSKKSKSLKKIAKNLGCDYECLIQLKNCWMKEKDRYPEYFIMRKEGSIQEITS